MKKLLFLLALCASTVIAAPVNVNTADAKTISEALSGIGLKKAEAIVKYRTEKGSLKTADDLHNVKGIGKKIIEKNRKDILLDESAAVKPQPTVETQKDIKSKEAAEPKKDDKSK